MKTIYVKDVVQKLLQTQRINWKKALPTLALFCGMFFLGREAAEIRAETQQTSGGLLQESENWGLGFGQPGQKPAGNASMAELAQYDAYYCGEGEEKVIYLTFDCGYENGNTEPILDALKKHNVKACFFVVGNYLDSAPELVQRMTEEGHIVGNHTLTHPDMSEIADLGSFQQQLEGVEEKYRQITGQEMQKFYRPPQGKFSESNLQQAQQLGYKTIFWSLAYVDWYADKQPSHEEAFEKLCGRIHPGAIVLLHSTSQTNAEILDELLTKWEGEGYTFKTLDQLGQ